MKRHFFAGLSSVVWLVCNCAGTVYAQSNIAIPHNSGAMTLTLAPPSACFYQFTDNGGVAGTYDALSGAGSVITFMPSSPGNKIIAEFTAFHTEEGFDGLFVYDGPDVDAPQIGSGAPALLGLPNPFSNGAGGWQGNSAPYNIAPNTVRATASNTSGALTFAFDSDRTIAKGGWIALVSEVPGNVCSLQAAGPLTVSATAGTCEADVQTAPPAITPGACAQILQLSYQLDDGPVVVVPTPAPPVVAIDGVPVGLHAITWRLTAPCVGSLAASTTQLLTVNDVTPPHIQAPANVTLSLGAGQCSAKYLYTVEAADDCNMLPEHTLETPVDFNNGAAGIMFDVKNIHDRPLEISAFGPVLDPGAWPVEVYVTATANTWQGYEDAPTAWRLLGTRKVVSDQANAGTPLTDFSLVLQPGESRGIYITSASGAPLRCTGTGAGVQRKNDDGVLEIASTPGASKGYPFAETGFSRAFNGFIKYKTSDAEPVMVSGLPSGAEFPQGVTNNVFVVTDQSGNSATASFSVTVQPFPDAVSTLICAGMVNASLGPACATTLQADDILLGGPYACFDHYIVEIDKIPPYNDGPWVAPNLGGADIGKTYGVRVKDPSNNNFCLGSVLVEDKLPPVLECKTVDLPCNFNADPTISAPATRTDEFESSASLPLKVYDFQSLTLDVPASLPDDAVVEDVDLYVRIDGDVFNKNLQLELESPSGTKIRVWDQATGCAAGPLWAYFDDEGSNNGDCSQFTTKKRVRIPFGAGAELGAFDGEPAKGNWKLHVRDLNGFGDAATVSEMSLSLRYHASFSAGFPNGLQFPGQITQYSPTGFVVPAPLLDGCSDVTLNYSDETVSQPCSTGLTAIILRTWTARDASNNMASCVQTIRMLRPGLTDVVLPPQYNEIDAPAFGCGTPYPTPVWIEGQGLQGAPRVFGKAAGCSINWSYDDMVVDVCQGSYTINRSWLIVDACTSQSMQAMQLIKVLDKQGPAINCPANLTVSTGLYNCCATPDLPDAVVEDACSFIQSASAKVVVFNQYSGDTTQVININGSLSNFPGNNTSDPDTLAAFGVTPCLPLGTHHVYYKLEDGCGNAKTCNFQLSVRDYTPPVAQGHSQTVVSLNADDPDDCYEPNAAGTRFAGVSTISAASIDQGSYDNCGFVKFTVRRVPPYSDCIESLNHENGGPPCQDGFPDAVSEFARATGESDSIKFYCCEAGTTQTLAFRCYQIDALGNLSLGANGQPLFNETLVQVVVQDKLSPGCQAPPDLTVACETFDPDLMNYGMPQLLDNCCLDTTKQYHSQAGLTHTVDYSQFDSLCGRGALLRTFRVYDCQGQTSSCSQTVTVTQNLDYAIKFPDDVIVEFCDSSGVYGKPVLSGQACELFAVSFTDVVFNVVTDGCYEIERTWRVKDLCNSLPGGNCIKIPNPTPVLPANSPENLTGPIVAPPGMPAPWNATITKITPDAQQLTDYSIYWEPSISCYEYKQVIRVIDKQAPVLESIPDTTLIVKDQSLNLNDLWNETYWYDDATDIHDLGEGPSGLTAVAYDLCSGTNVDIRFLLFLDLDGDGSQETVVNSASLPGYNNVQFGNAANPNYSGGESRAFDERAVPANEKYGFALQTAVTGNKKTATVCWNTQAQPNDYKTPELPYGKHRIRWILSDGCGNESYREHAFEVKDSKAPTVVCLNGLSVNIASQQSVNLWATDFLNYAEDNYTPPTSFNATPNLLQFAIRKSGQGAGFPADTLGNPINGISYSCDEIGVQEVELWAMDLDGNAGYCSTFVEIQDNDGLCTPDSYITVAGALKTETGDGVEDALVNIQANALNMTAYSDDQGQYTFANQVPLGSDYTITPVKDDNPLNGVSTYDLVLISKHIIGLEPLSSPYKMIAADANRSNSITTFDIVELRKLILGIYNELPGNTSWRFVDKDFIFSQSTNPFVDTIPELIQVPGAMSDLLSGDFVGVKVGDVNGTAVANALVSADDRTAGTLLFDLEDRNVRAGEVFEVRFKAAEAVQGFQFTLVIDGLEVAGIEEGDRVGADNFGVFADALTVSIDGADAFAVNFRAKKPGRLSDMLKLSGHITRAEAYLPAEAPEKASTLGIALRFRDQHGTTVSGMGFELYQNQPNPFVHKTLIGFHLPEATEAALTVFDETGRVLFMQKGEYAKGYNAVNIDRSLLNATGVMYYKLETATDVATRKMIVVK
ncbi:MAG: proprotein convertase P-domain-containing protein [Lewinellaceae bacterium]|nr:proprotein convertase P-domain-containing protein [Lewinellaceae bacterium]